MRQRLRERQKELWTVERLPVRAEGRGRKKMSSIHCAYVQFELTAGHLKEMSSRQLMIGI